MGRNRHASTVSDVAAKGDRALEPSEAAFAALLDRAGIAYEYEPHRLSCGPLAVDGKVARRALQPDFWLPGLNLYVELTTSRMGGPNMRLKLAKVAKLKDGQGDKRIAILNGARLERVNASKQLGHADVVAVLESVYAHTCRRAGIRTLAESQAAREVREAQRELAAV